jgi:hypothetical protein
MVYKKTFLLFVSFVLVMQIMIPVKSVAGGISVDAGLTPAQDRWIVRSHVRHMEKQGTMMGVSQEMETIMIPLVVAYGLKPELAVMVRQGIMFMDMEMGGEITKKSGFGDLFMLAKYKAFRRNTHAYTLGIAPMLGMEFPSGKKGLSSETWDLTAGTFASLRRGALALDLNIAYALNGLGDRTGDGVNPGDELSLDGAIAWQFGIGANAYSSIAPVLEISFIYCWPDKKDGGSVMNTGERMVLVSPGVKFTLPWLILEVLVQVPVWQKQNGVQPERSVGGLAGFRLMF